MQMIGLHSINKTTIHNQNNMALMNKMSELTGYGIHIARVFVQLNLKKTKPYRYWILKDYCHGKLLL